ncbi:hypothetical protein B0O79_2503 [Flavobacteriaceae bacterium MAR_2009_75]|nr:hypothetical protein B0O79_2503 [Flavobacteriaceae bacterium MAR_2009_75]
MMRDWKVSLVKSTVFKLKRALSFDKALLREHYMKMKKFTSELLHVKHTGEAFETQLNDVSACISVVE